ncbi:arylamine N-acetyltransferase 1 [Decorospora gaudefroyi]|uniref:Arylamine N-acetyltransferase 1 n=1 Tax=Decorospora gaudefroyi TaxID=184978 RepID=A0A6A5KBR3_9PLEO|nr:arylamine N-acetyltransferase 1 [Decorospora gaudefroyi]
MSAHATYTHDQITQYFDRLGLSGDQRQYNVSQLSLEDRLAYLLRLQTLHLAKIPFENLNLHYSAHHAVSVHPEQLFNKIIGDNNGRGGYCMENNRLFGTLLNSLGFTLYSAGCRVFDAGTWTGWSHMVNLVTLGDTKYHVDVGFGADGPIAPMPLHRSGSYEHHVEPATVRLQWRNIPGNTDPNQRLWVYEYKQNNDSAWEIKYCYSELEFQPQDYEVMNYFTSTSQRTFFTRMVVADRKILGDDGELVGKMSLAGNGIKWNIRGLKTKEIEFKSEGERLEALEKYFGIRFGAVERAGIAGMASEIK